MLNYIMPKALLTAASKCLFIFKI